MYGFCLPPLEGEKLKTDPPTEVDAFVDAVFVAEGMDPWNSLHLRRQVKKRVAQAFWKTGYSDWARLEPALRQTCRRAFRDFQLPPSLVLDYLAIDTPGLLVEAGFSDGDVDALMPLLDRVIDDAWAARRAE